MNILLCVKEQDIKLKILGKTLFEYTYNKYKNENLFIFTDDKNVKKYLESFKCNILFMNYLSDAIKYTLSKVNDTFIVISKLAISTIDLAKLLLYHKYNKKLGTVLCKNLVLNKATPIYKLDDNKLIISITKKRYVNCGIFIFEKEIVNFKINTLTNLLDELSQKKELKAFVYKGIFYCGKNIVENSNKKQKMFYGIEYQKIKEF